MLRPKLRHAPYHYATLEKNDLHSFWSLLRTNRNYRYTWFGQTVSEVGDHFNTIAVLSLALHIGGSGFAVGMVMLSRIIPAILAGPVAGVILDRADRRQGPSLACTAQEAINRSRLSRSEVSTKYLSGPPPPPLRNLTRCRPHSLPERFVNRVSISK